MFILFKSYFSLNYWYTYLTGTKDLTPGNKEQVAGDKDLDPGNETWVLETRPVLRKT